MEKFVVKTNKEYFKAITEFANSQGSILTEFDGEIATRQISIVAEKIFVSSCIQDWNEEIGYLLYDGNKSELDLSESIIISEEEFEAQWQLGLLQDTKRPELNY